MMRRVETTWICTAMFFRTLQLRVHSQSILPASVMNMNAAIEETRILTGLRDALLPKFISSKVRVKDARRMIELA